MGFWYPEFPDVRLGWYHWRPAPWTAVPWPFRVTRAVFSWKTLRKGLIPCPGFTPPSVIVNWLSVGKVGAFGAPMLIAGAAAPRAVRERMTENYIFGQLTK